MVKIMFMAILWLTADTKWNDKWFKLCHRHKTYKGIGAVKDIPDSKDLPVTRALKNLEHNYIGYKFCTSTGFCTAKWLLQY